MKTMNKPVLIPVMTGLFALACAGVVQAQEERGRVISSTPVMQQIAVPRQVCQDQTVTVPGQKSGAGALIGGIAGGAMGNAVGNGSGRALATMIGLVGGAIVGDRVEGGGQAHTQTVRQCDTQHFYENQTVAYNVVYEYAGRQYSTQMPQDPGRFVRLSVTPVDAAPAPRYAPQVQYQQPAVPVVTRVVVGTSFYPAYAVAPQVVYVNGYRQAPGQHMRPRHSRHDRGGDQRWERDDDRWERDDRWVRNWR